MARNRAPGPHLPDTQTSRAFRGRMILYDNQGTLVAAKWPKKRGTPKSETTRAQNSLFTETIKAMPYVDPEQRVNAMAITQGTAYTWRDALFMAMHGNWIELEGLADMAISDQLDMITSTPGAMLYRGPDGWVGLEPASNDAVLAFDVATQLPFWHDPFAIGIQELTGDVTAGPGSGSQVATLSDTGIDAGTYVAATIQVDAKGRLIDATNGPTAEVGSLGLVAPDGSTITIDGDGNISATPDALPIAEVGLLGKVMPDGTTIGIDGDGNISALASPVGGYGLFAPKLPAIPSAANTGLSTWLNQGGASVADEDQGIVLDVPASSVVSLRSRLVNAPGSTPWTLTALCGLDSGHFDFSGVYIAVSDGTKLQILYFRHANGINQLEVDSFTNSTTYNSTQATTTNLESNPIWLRIFNNASNLFFQYSFTGSRWITLYTVSLASSFLGATGNTKLAFGGNDQSSRGAGVECLLWKVT